MGGRYRCSERRSSADPAHSARGEPRPWRVRPRPAASAPPPSPTESSHVLTILLIILLILLLTGGIGYSRRGRRM
jgi:hypothetical protein